MKSNSELKDIAANTLSGDWAYSALVTLVYLLIFLVVPLPFACIGDSGDTVSLGENISSIVVILLLPLGWGYAVFFLNMLREDNSSMARLFDGFRNGNYKRILGTLLLENIYIMLWSILLVIPGIVKTYSYSMTSYLMKDNPSLKYNAAIEESMRLMQGHKMQLFLLDLSMIGWAILSFLTAGIGFLFLGPYNLTAHAAFYQDLVAEDNPDAYDYESADYEEPVDGPDFEEVK